MNFIKKFHSKVKSNLNFLMNDNSNLICYSMALQAFQIVITLFLIVEIAISYKLTIDFSIIYFLSIAISSTIIYLSYGLINYEKIIKG